MGRTQVSGKILFMSDRDDLCIINPDGTGSIHVGSNLFDPSLVCPSPDEKRIVFDEFDHRRCRHIGYVMTADGTEKTEIRDISGHYRWSPDGKKILGHDKWGNSRIINIDRARKTNPVYVDADAVFSDWSPNGKKIVYQDGSSLYIVNADGTNKTMILADLPTEMDYSLDTPSAVPPRYSPDGEKIAVVIYKRSTLCVINPDGTGMTKIAPDVHTFAWSPDGKRIAYIRRQINELLEGALYIINADGTGEFCLCETRTFYWMPDGKKIIYQNGSSLYIVNADNRTDKTLITNTLSDRDFTLSPDREWVAYKYTDRFEDDYIKIINVDGTGETVLTQGTVVAWLPAPK